MRITRVVLWLVLIVVIANCGGGGTEPIQPSPPPPPPANVKTIELAYPTATLARGQTLSLTATLKDDAGNVLTGKTLAWTTENAAVVAVGASGAVGALTATGAGSAKVTGTVDGVSASSTVTVVAFSSIFAGPMISCAITPDGKLYCSGGSYGTAAQPVARTLRFSAVSSNSPGAGGPAQACALATDASAWCWGDNASGQLGVGDLTARTEPTRVVGNLQMASISVGRDYTCGLTTAGDAYCWGAGANGQLGTGSLSSSSTPIAVQGGLKFTLLEAGSGTTCGLTAAGKAWCWGRNNLGQLGTGDGGQPGNESSVPVAVGEPVASSTMSQIVTRGPKVCALTSTGKAFCWGNNTVSELGSLTGALCDGGKPCSLSPVAVSTAAVFKSLTASQFATCGLTTAAETLCWGMDFENLFGAAAGAVPSCPVAGSLYGCAATPVAGPSGFVTLSGSISNHCGMKSDGVAYCWGGNASGQRGWGSTTPDPTPRPFSIAPASTP